MADKKIDAMQDDIKLLKGEIKQSLASVRDYLLNMELPSSEIANILAALSGEGERVTMKGSLDAPQERQPLPPQEPPPPPPSDLANQEELMEMDDPVPDNSLSQSSAMDGRDDSFGSGDFSEDTAPADGFGDNMSTGPLPEDRQPSNSRPDNPGLDNRESGDPDDFQDPYNYADFDDDPRDPFDRYGDPSDMRENPLYDRPAPEDNLPRVNMLANLINWVSRAKQEIGQEQLPVFLEVYGISGHLSPELKEIILHLAEITGDKPQVNTGTGVWSESMLTLHGILTGGEAPLHPVLPSWCSGPDAQLEEEEEEDISEPEEEEESQGMPVKLKLVFPSSNGKGREYCIDLSPEQEADTDEPVRRTKRTGR